MRDIRDDLTERLAEIAQQIAQYQRALDMLTTRSESIEVMLELEELRFREGSQGRLSGMPRRKKAKIDSRVKTPLGRFVLQVLSDHKPHSLAEIRDVGEEEGMTDPTKNLGRQVHWALVGLMQNKFVERLPDKRWIVPNGTIT